MTVQVNLFSLCVFLADYKKATVKIRQVEYTSDINTESCEETFIERRRTIVPPKRFLESSDEESEGSNYNTPNRDSQKLKLPPEVGGISSILKKARRGEEANSGKEGCYEFSY